MKVCQQCGFKNNDQSSFCTNCGSNIENMVSVTPDNVETQKTEPETPKVQENSKTQKTGPETPKAQENSETQKKTRPIPPGYIFNPNTGRLLLKKMPEEKRLKKFAKKEKSVAKKINKLQCPLADLFTLSATEEEYKKTASYFKTWVEQYIVPKFPGLPYFAMVSEWDHFQYNCTSGLLALMIIGEYGEGLKYANTIINHEEILYKKGIGAYTGPGGLVANLKIMAATTGKTGTDREKKFMHKVKFFKAICLCDLGIYDEARNILAPYPANYGFVLGIDNEYYNQNFKYRNKLYAPYIYDLCK